MKPDSLLDACFIQIKCITFYMISNKIPEQQLLIITG